MVSVRETETDGTSELLNELKDSKRWNRSGRATLTESVTAPHTEFLIKVDQGTSENSNKKS